MSDAPRTRDQELMMLHDGELSEREARAAEERAAASPEDRARLDALREVGDVLRARLDLAAEEAAPRLDALWSQIEGELAPAPASSRARRAAEPEGGGFFAWLRGHQGHVLTGAVCAAAGALLVLLLREPRTTVVVTPIIKEVPVPAAPVEPQVQNADAEVESLEVVGGTGTVFHIAGEDDESPTTVIWVTRDDAPPEGPI